MTESILVYVNYNFPSIDPIRAGLKAVGFKHNIDEIIS